MIRVVVLTAAAFLSALPLAAQNLVVNPDFDDTDQITGWTCTATYGLPSWSTEDREGSATSGSMQHDVSADSNNQTVECDQCLAVTELHSYVASMWNFWPSDVDVTQDGSSRITFGFFSDPSCTNLVEWGSIGVNPFPLYSLDTWVPLKTGEAVAPIGAAYALLRFVTWQDLADEPVRARIDDIDFRTTTIFLDGFESGSTGAWGP